MFLRHILLLSFLGLLLMESGLAAPVPTPPELDAFLEKNCYECHDDVAEKGDLNLLDADFDLTEPANYHLWAGVFDRIDDGSMPPEDQARPDPEEKEGFLAGLSHELAELERARIADNGRAAIRRLSRNEYENTLKDLLHLPNLEIGESLPPEGNAHGFDKSADALDFSHIHASRLLEAADKALSQAVAFQAMKPEPQVIRFEVKDPINLQKNMNGFNALLKQSKGIPLNGMEIDTTVTRIRGDFAKGNPGETIDEAPHFDGLAIFINGEFNLGMSIRPFTAKVPGYYKIRVNGFGVMNEFGELVPSDRTETVGFYSSDRTLGFVDLPSYEPTTAELTVWLEPGDPVKPLVASSPFPKIQTAVRTGAGEVVKQENEAFRRFKANGVAFRWFELEGPLYDEWPPKSHRKLFGNHAIVPGPERSGVRGVADIRVEDTDKEARALLRRFITEALRRPLQDGDMKIPMSVVNRKLRRGATFMEAMLAGYRSVLTSPDFLITKAKPGKLDDFALAERLSYFLWNSAPDRALWMKAYEGELSDPEVLRSEVNRLLDDPRSGRFASHFLDKWLKLEDIALTEPDANLYPDYTPLLMDSALWESEAFFMELIREDLPARNVIDSDFVMINQRLAELYGIPGVSGNHIRKVALPDDSKRGGFLTQASVLKTSANGTVTSPVVRGDYVQVHLIGDPPPPPPPSVPAVEPDITGATTIREQLAQHSSDQSCASCHAKIDPPGFALESFDVMGGYREKYRSLKRGERLGLFIDGRPSNARESQPVDASGELPDKGAFSDVNGFRELLLQDEAGIARNLLNQLIVYGTGAPVGFADRAETDALMASLAESDYGVRSMIHAIVQSPLFLNK